MTSNIFDLVAALKRLKQSRDLSATRRRENAERYDRMLARLDAEQLLAFSSLFGVSPTATGADILGALE